MTLPGSKRQKIDDHGVGGWPDVPILTNSKAIKKHTQLMALPDSIVARAHDAEKAEKRKAQEVEAKAVAKGKAKAKSAAT